MHPGSGCRGAPRQTGRADQRGALHGLDQGQPKRSPGRDRRLSSGEQGHSRRRRRLAVPPGRSACGTRGRNLSRARRLCSECRSRSRSRGRSGSRAAWLWKSNGAGAENVPRVFVGVGSNIAPEENVTRALRLLDGEIGILGISTFYRTPALNRPEEPPYVNGVVEVGDALGPFDLKELLQHIERALGRERAADRYAPRAIGSGSPYPRRSGVVLGRAAAPSPGHSRATLRGGSAARASARSHPSRFGDAATLGGERASTLFHGAASRLHASAANGGWAWIMKRWRS